jgi:hypothetical protein
MTRAEFFNAYLFAWIFWLGASLGSMALTMMHHLTGGYWGILIRPITTAAQRTLPLLFILFLPVFLGLPELYPWARPAQVNADAILAHIHSYLNPQFFALRFVIYFAVWIGMMWGLVYVKNEGIRRRISAGGLVVYVVTMSLAGVDWIMSRQPHWVSSVFGFILVISQTLTALCLAIVVLWKREHRPAIRDFAKPSYFIDLGNMLLMFVILWAYLNFAQFLITWTGNEQPDIAYYVQRTYGGWRVLAAIVVYANFLVPLFLLLFRSIKGDIRRLGILCAALFILRILDAFWDIAPLGQSDPHGGFTISFWEPVLFVVIGGIWFAAFLHYLKQSPDLMFLDGDEANESAKTQSA